MSQSRDQEFTLEDEFFRQIPRQFQEELFLAEDFGFEFLDVYRLDRFEGFFVDVEAFELDVHRSWHPAQHGLLGVGPAVGTLDDPHALKPDVHIYTRSKVPWIALPPGVPAFEAYYDSKTLWPAASLERRRALFAT